MSLRLYLPTTLGGLAAAHAAGTLPADDPVAAPDDSEESEYAALMTAADASALLLAGEADGRRRRVVVVVEVDARPAPGTPIPLADVVAVHVDTVDDADPDDDLAWFATQEIPHLLDRRDAEN